MHWIIFGVFGVIATSIANLFQKVAMKDEKSDPVISAIFFQFTIGIVTNVFAVLKGFSWPDQGLFPHFLAGGMLYAIGSICFFRAIKKIEASEMTVLAGSGVIFTICASIVFLGDRLSLVQLSGTALIFLAVTVTSWRKNILQMNSGMWLALGGAASYGFAVVFDSFVVKRYSAISFLPLSNYITASILLLCYYKRARDIIPALRKANKNLIIYSVIYALAAIAFYIGLERGALVGQISSVWRVSSVLTVILAGIYLHEAKHLGRKIIGAILTTIGVFLVS